MKRKILIILAGILLFFILLFIQEYETFIMPLIGSTRKIDYNMLGDLCIKTVETFNALLSEAYNKMDTELIAKLPAVDGIKSEYVSDINFYKKDGVVLEFKFKESELLDLMFFSEKGGRLTQRELWEMKVGKELKEVNLIVDYTFSTDGRTCLIESLKNEEASS